MAARSYAKNHPVRIAGAVTALLVSLVALGLDAVNWGDSVEAQLVVLGGILATIVGDRLGKWFERYTVSVAVDVPEGDDLDHTDVGELGPDDLLPAAAPEVDLRSLSDDAAAAPDQE